LLNALELAIEGDETEREKYGWYNGLLFAVRNTSAEDAAKSFGLNRPSVAWHVDHVRVCLAYTRHLLADEADTSDWPDPERVRAPSESEWDSIRSNLEGEYVALREFLQNKPFWREPSLSAAINNIAHTAYHAGAVRQILKAIP
jgi:hypothetical protein